MIVLQHIPAVISAILLGAHFLRDGNLLITLVCLAMPFLLLSPSKTRVRIYQAFLAVGALIWIATAVGVAMDRIDSGRPWIRMAVILGAVTFLNVAAAFLFETKMMRARYRGPIE